MLAEFSLIDSSGNTVGAGTQGLLISNGGTVCYDYFNDNAANIICRKMGYFAHTSWTFGYKWDIQYELDINLDDIKCGASRYNNNWSSCSYSTKNDCSHSEDVFLQCKGHAGDAYYTYSYLKLCYFVSPSLFNEFITILISR